MVTTAMSVNLSLITMHENEVVKRLAAYASLVAVPTLIAGIYGMNFDYMPELRLALGLSARARVDGHRRPLSGVSVQEGEVVLERRTV